MPASQRTLVRAAAVLGAACLLVAPLASGARAQTVPISVYEARGIGTAVGMQFAFSPSIFDPLLDIGLLYGTSGIDSAGAGQANALAAIAYPGSLVVGGAGCAGVPGPPWVQAYYPKTEGCPLEQEATLNRTQPSTFSEQLDPILNEVLERVALAQVHLLAETDLGLGRSLVELQDIALAADRNGAPVARIGSLLIESHAALEGNVGHRVTVTAKDVDVLGMVHIASVVSVAETSSDASLATAEGSLTIVGATTDIDGAPRRITIDDEGIHVTDSDLSHEQRLGLQEKIEETMLAAGLEIVAASPVEIVDGTKAETSVGGLIIAVKGAIPSVSVPREVAQVLGQVIEQIPTQCLSDFGAPLPVCFGAGALPGPGTAVKMSFNIASASSFTVGEAPTFTFDPGGGDTGTIDGGFQPGIDPFQPAPQGPTFDPGDQGTAAPPRQQPTAGNTGPLVGLVARLPAVGLLWGGVGLLIFALGLTFGPSLRHARTH
ncbi:MAG TPA: hypothetical protein VGB52_12825 [Actinomycetota bacterium]